MNCIFICVFHQLRCLDIFYVLLESILLYGNLGENTHVLVYTSSEFMNMIKQHPLFDSNKIKFEINDTYNDVDSACKSRIDVFDLLQINNYEKILYLDSDILVKDDIHQVFDVCKDDILYTLEEGAIDSPTDFWGNILFGDDVRDYEDRTAFTSGILLFRNCEKMKFLFQRIQECIVNRPYQFICYDQPYIVYNAFKYNLYNNKLLIPLAVNCNKDIDDDRIIQHFSGGPGIFESKHVTMSRVLDKMKESKRAKNNTNTIVRNIPKILFQTNKTNHEPYVIELIMKQLSSEWKYEFYDDADVIQFFIHNPLSEYPDIIQRYNSFTKGAHRADLFRYYYLYVNGGFFMDSDAMIYINIDSIVKDYDFVSVDSSCHPGTIFQGILGASRNNEIIKRVLHRAYNTDQSVLDSNYHYFCKQLYDIINECDYGYRIKLYEEIRRTNHHEVCDNILDGETILFTHYWLHKKIPVTLYTKEFTEIYNTKYWIKGSGEGSSIENTEAYNSFIIDFIKKHNIRSITDIGCGDWQSSYLIYQQLDDIDYVGIDCVESVIQQNKQNHPKYTFCEFDILCNVDLIRDSDLYIMKDVLQHLKLKDIYEFLDKLVLKKFKYIIITNNGHQMCDDFELDIIGNGRGLRSDFFPLKKYNAKPLLDYFGGENKHICFITKDDGLIKYTDWNNYNKSELNNFDYRILNTYKIPNTLIRLGPNSDGGYVIVDGFDYDLFISCGIAYDTRFEDDFLDIHKIKCVAFDGTIQSFPCHRNNIEWIAKNIGYSNTETTTNLKEYIRNGKKIFLKMDIEGSEFNWLDSMTEDELDNISQLVLEVHWPFDKYRMKMLSKLNQTHYIIHIHGNNYCDRDIPKHLPSGRTYDGTVHIHNIHLPEIKLPEVFEVTYINKRLCDREFVKMKVIPFPTALDYPNNPNADDIRFSIPIIYENDEC